MARMLRTGASHEFGCCDHCARKKAPDNKPDKRERRVARARENRSWRRDAERD